MRFVQGREARRHPHHPWTRRYYSRRTTRCWSSRTSRYCSAAHARRLCCAAPRIRPRRHGRRRPRGLPNRFAPAVDAAGGVRRNARAACTSACSLIFVRARHGNGKRTMESSPLRRPPLCSPSRLVLSSPLFLARRSDVPP
jgi:hypothetical protein